MKPKVVVVSAECGDWDALYINGDLAFEGHSIHWSHFASALGIEYNAVEVTDEYAERGMPGRLGDIPGEAFVKL